MRLNLIMAVAIVFSLVTCKNSKTEPVASAKHEHGAGEEQHFHHEDCSEVHWSHKKGEDGPENWKNLCPGFADCGGKAQSPINIITENAVNEDKLSNLVINYSTSPTEIINNGHTVQFNISGDHTLTVGDKVYELIQFHYHAHSEHAINGEYYPIEVHFVHKYSDDDLAVVGIMFTPGEEYEVFNKNIDSLPGVGEAYNPDYLLDLSHLNESKPSYYYYKGSLTTPPCTEIVNWIVLKDPIEASESQITRLAEILHNDFRPEMPLNDRTVYKFEE